MCVVAELSEDSLAEASNVGGGKSSDVALRMVISYVDINSQH